MYRTCEQRARLYITTECAEPKARTDCEPRRPQALARAARPLFRRPHDRPRLDDRERRAAFHPGRSRLLAGLARLGRERLPADVRRLPPLGRTPRRHLRPPPPLPDWPHRLHARLARLRSRHLAGVP